MIVTVLISVTGSTDTACIHDYFCPVPILYYFFLWQETQLVIVLGTVTQTFILERSEPLVVLAELGCSCPLILITGHGNMERCP